MGRLKRPGGPRSAICSNPSGEADLLGTFRWDHFIAVQIWIFVLFLAYVTASEINNLLGDGELFKILFTRRSSEPKSTRRARIRLLVRLARLLDATRSTC